MACSALLVSVLVVVAAGGPASSLRGLGRAEHGKCCFNGCDDENSCVTDYCALQVCMKLKIDDGCDSSPPYGDGAKPIWCPATAPGQLYSSSPDDNVTANAMVNALQTQASCKHNGEYCEGASGGCCSGRCDMYQCMGD
jgi:hypothetical protein